MAPSLHPIVDNGIVQGDDSFPGGTLQCYCTNNPVQVKVGKNVVQNHACGCTKCWKPQGSLFSIVGAVPRTLVEVTANANKLYVLDASMPVQRNVCKECGVHMFGRIEEDHPFKGFDFVHVELSSDKGWQAPFYASYVSSIIESGFHPAGMDDVRSRLKALGWETFDVTPPQMSDRIATWRAQRSGALPTPLPA
jgi:S-(hydroxymethyl)glutathione synthase